MIASDARILIVGDSGALERLRGELPSSGIELRPIEDFLVAYDRDTLIGEGQLRRMEELFASLRGKLIVRLMLVDLNPETISKQGDRLQEIADSWKCIEDRLAELLDERRGEGIDFVTVLVTEQGDWTKERTAILDRFSQNSKDSKIRMRCYLMTRLLELGRDRVVHAKDAWPSFVAGLIRHFLWKDRIADNQHFFDCDGLYAWRTLQIVTGVPESTVREHTRKILAEVTSKFFGERPSPLFPNPLNLNSENTGGDFFETPVQNPFESPAWNELGIKDETKLSALEAPSKWALDTQAHAHKERKSAWEARGNESPKPFKAAGARVNDAKEIPGKIFPGSLPSPPIKELPDVKSVLQGIQIKLDKVNAETKKIRDWWDDHLQAAYGFLVTSERLIVGLIVSMALAYGILSVQMTVQKYLRGSLFPFERGLMLAGLAVAGVFVMLLVGYLTQSRRGRSAKKKLKDLGDKWINDSVAFRQKIADSLRCSRQTGKYIREAAARRQLVKRLHRIEQILSAELQPSTIEDDDGISSMLHGDQAGEDERYRKLLEVVVDSAPKAGFSVDNLIDKITRDFFREWKALLDQAGDRVMISAPAVLGLCQRSVLDLRQCVEDELKESAASQLASEKAEQVEAALVGVKLDGNERHFYSVDLSGGDPRDSVWYRRGFKAIFESSGFEKAEELELGKGVLAVLYGECPLRIEETKNQRRLEFLPNH